MEQRYSKNPQIELAPLEQESILFDPTSNKFLVLNSTSSFVWDRLSEGGTARELARDMCESFQGVGLPEALSDIERILDEMSTHGVVIGNIDQSTLQKENPA